MKKLILKLSAWWYRQRPHKPSGQWLIDWLFKFRLAQALQASGSVVVAFSGDSRWHQGENILQKQAGWRVFAVSGSKADPDGLRYGAAISGLCKAQVTAIDWAGNDFLQNAKVKDVLKAHLDVRARIALQGGIVLSYEICPLGLPAANPVNVKIARFNALLAAAIGPDFVKLNHILAPGGTMLQKYDSGDHIHWTDAAFNDAVIPQTKAALRAMGVV